MRQTCTLVPDLWRWHHAGQGPWKPNRMTKFANILNVVVERGTFQQRLVALTFIPNMLSAFFIFADIFMFTARSFTVTPASWILAVGPNLSR